MRIKGVRISNFRAITSLSLNDLRDTVVIAGPNGCGKSCLFDAIRLLKSAYGGYQPNEWHQWFGEFQLNVNQSSAGWLSLLQDTTKPLEISVDFQLSEAERSYLKTHAEILLNDQAWRELVPELASWRYIGSAPLASNMRVHEPRIQQLTRERLPQLIAVLEHDTHTGRLVVSGGARSVNTFPSLLLELLFGRYDPQNIGIIDYHSANRNYTREQIGGINLNIESSEERMRQHALYNSAGKYSNLKSEMAGSYIRQLLGKEACSDVAVDQSLSTTLQELFATFFPGKEFLGPQPTNDGRLLFPVRTPKGEHDIDELSSGEKEVLYGYLRLRNAAPRNSVLLIDEPELHLNPRLVNGLASFYHKHLGKPLNTQLWLVTHSDTFIREALGQDGFSVFHMQPAGQYEGDNQITTVEVAADLDRLVMELVGDLAAYRPGAKIVVFEGDSESEFDVRMVSTLFPDFQSKINSISGGNKQRVAQLYELLEEARKAGHIPGRFYAVTDADGELAEPTPNTTRYRWDVYHIENYLLVPAYILQVLRDLNVAAPAVDTEVKILAVLRECAFKTVKELVSHKLRVSINQALVSCLDFRFDPHRDDVATAFGEALARSKARINERIDVTFSASALAQKEEEFRLSTAQDLEGETWMRTFRGRDVLKRFVAAHGAGLAYEPFRELIISRMRDADYQPPGMAQVVNAILADGIAPLGPVGRPVASGNG